MRQTCVLKVLSIPSLDLWFFLPFFPFLCFLCLKPGEKNNKTPKLTPTSQQKSPKPNNLLLQPCRATHAGGGTVPTSCPGSQWPFPSSGKCGHACARASRNLPQFQPRPGSTRAKGREAAGEGCLGVPGKLCHPREAVSPSGSWVTLSTFLSLAEVSRCRFPRRVFAQGVLECVSWILPTETGSGGPGAAPGNSVGRGRGMWWD